MKTNSSASSQPAARVVRRLGFAAAYALFLALCVLAVDYLFFWRPFVAELRQSPPGDLEPPPNVDALTMLRLGSLRADRTTSFSKFPKEKGHGVIRVCAFGDSFTYGDEVADGHDFPAFLQALFAASGIDNVEVLNFGNSWYGFHQTHILWDGVGRQLQCDYVLLGPDGFQPERDTTFNHTGLARPYYLHARYVLDGNDVRLIDVLGRDPRERFDNYLGFIPRWQYLRYDRNPPAILQSVLGRTRTQTNVFYYYRGSADEESLATYTALLRKLAADGVQILLLHSLDGIVHMASGIDRANLLAVFTPRVVRYPYSAPGGHYSAFGNRLIAEQFHALLTLDPTSIQWLDFTDVEAVPQGSATERRPLSDYDRIELRMAGQSAGLLAVASPNPALRMGSVTDLHNSSVTSLLAFKNPSSSIVDAAFVVVDRRLEEGEPLTVRVQDGTSAAERIIGRVRLIDPRLNIGVAETAGFSFDWGQLWFDGGSRVEATSEWPRGQPVTFFVGPSPVLRGVTDEGPVPLLPVDEPLRTFRVEESKYVDVSRLSSSGVLTLMLQSSGAGTLETPLARWQKRAGTLPEVDRRLPMIIAVRGTRAVMAESDSPE